MRDSIRIEALETLEAINKYGSFAAAAAALYRVPSAISYTINQLEKDLGIKVFDRSGHRAILTPAGRLLLEEGRRITRASRELAAAARRQANQWEPELKIAVETTVHIDSLWPLLEEFSRTHPEIDIRIHEEVLAGTWEALIDKHVDIALGVARPPANADIQRLPFKRLDFVFCCAPDHPLARAGKPLTEAEIRAYRTLVVADTARQFSRRQGNLIDNQPRLTVANMQTKLQAIERGLGVGYCPAAWVSQALQQGRLAAPPVLDPAPSLQTHVLWRREKPGRALNWLIKRLRSELD